MEPNKLVKTYSNGTITIVWKPGACIHSTVCWKEATGLPAVFNPREKPWIKMEGASTEAISAQVNKCPSGALSFYYNEASGKTSIPAVEARVEVIRNGPILITGELAVKDQNGNETRQSKTTAFCRCGLSANKPFCDGSHNSIKLDG